METDIVCFIWNYCDFTASQLVDWFIKAGLAEDRNGGVKLGQVCVCCDSIMSGDVM